MSVVYDGPLPPSKAKKVAPPSRSTATPVSSSPATMAPQASVASVPTFAVYDGPLPSGRAAARSTAAPERSTASRRSQPAQSADSQESQGAPPASSSNGSALPYDEPLPSSKPSTRNSSRTAASRTPPPRPGIPGRRTIPEDGPQLPTPPLLQTFIPSLNAYMMAKIGKTGEVRNHKHSYPWVIHNRNL